MPFSDFLFFLVFVLVPRDASVIGSIDQMSQSLTTRVNQATVTVLAVGKVTSVCLTICIILLLLVRNSLLFKPYRGGFTRQDCTTPACNNNCGDGKCLS